MDSDAIFMLTDHNMLLQLIYTNIIGHRLMGKSLRIKYAVAAYVINY